MAVLAEQKFGSDPDLLPTVESFTGFYVRWGFGFMIPAGLIDTDQ